MKFTLHNPAVPCHCRSPYGRQFAYVTVRYSMGPVGRARCYTLTTKLPSRGHTVVEVYGALQNWAKG